MNAPIDKCYPKVLKRAKNYKRDIDKYTLHCAKASKRAREIEKIKLDAENGLYEPENELLRNWKHKKVEVQEPKKSFWKWSKDKLCELLP